MTYMKWGGTNGIYFSINIFCVYLKQSKLAGHSKSKPKSEQFYFKKTDCQNIRYFYVSGIQMYGIWIPTVFSSHHFIIMKNHDFVDTITYARQNNNYLVYHYSNNDQESEKKICFFYIALTRDCHQVFIILQVFESPVYKVLLYNSTNGLVQ